MKAPPLALRSFCRLPGRRPFVLGHRGARADRPENTIAAFEEALRQGADGVELDVRMSADGELWVAHDDELSIISDPSGPTPHGETAPEHAPGQTRVRLSELSSDQIRHLGPVSGEPVPTLQRALLFQAQTGCLMNVELKSDTLAPLWMARRASEIVRAHGGHGILFSSFHPLVVRELTTRLPEVPSALLFDPNHTYARRLMPFGLIGASAAHPQSTLLDEPFIARLRHHVQVINTWTVNDPTEAQHLSNLGIDAIVTDHPRKILESLPPHPHP